MNRETVIIGEREFAMSKIPTYAAHQLALKLSKVVVPLLGEAAKFNGPNGLMNADVGALAAVVASNLTEQHMTDIVFPAFKASAVACTTENVKIESPSGVDKVFKDVDELADFYLLIVEVFKFNFTPFFSKMANLFGSSIGGLKTLGQT